MKTQEILLLYALLNRWPWPGQVDRRTLISDPWIHVLCFVSSEIIFVRSYDVCPYFFNSFLEFSFRVYKTKEIKVFKTLPLGLFSNWFVKLISVSRSTCELFKFLFGFSQSIDIFCVHKKHYNGQSNRYSAFHHYGDPKPWFVKIWCWYNVVYSSFIQETSYSFFAYLLCVLKIIINKNWITANGITAIARI